MIEISKYKGDTVENLDINLLDAIVKKTVDAIETSKTQIFDIYEAGRRELENIKRDVEKVKQQAVDIIFTVDELEKKERRSRMRLAEVSRNFHRYSEEDIRQAYEDTNQLQIDLAVARAQEQALRQRRDELELRMRKLKDTVNKAESLVSQVGAVLGFLGNQMENVVSHIESMQQRQIFGSKIIKAQEEERRRVAREIHDGPAQDMANIVFRAEVCERLIDTDLGRAKNELGELREQVRVCLQEIRKIIFDLRPMTIDDLGVVATVRKILETMKDEHKIIAELRVMGEEKRLDSYIEIGMFRIIQEALTNIIKHAQATIVLIRIDFSPKFIFAIIEDNGKGFDSTAEIGNESFGLMGMKERINLLNGELTIKSAVGTGTKVIIKVPLK